MTLQFKKNKATKEFKFEESDQKWIEEERDTNSNRKKNGKDVVVSVWTWGCFVNSLLYFPYSSSVKWG